jgi:hypothetical protein
MSFQRKGSPEPITDVLPDKAGLIDDGTVVMCPRCNARHLFSHGLIKFASGRTQHVHGKNIKCDCGHEFKWKK